MIFEWAIIGAGPAGIATIGQLLEKGIPASQILWIDPYFKAGDFGRYWRNVSSNTTVELFTRYLNHLKSFEYQSHPPCAFDALPQDDTCKLEYMVEPLEWLTNRLQSKVTSVQATVKSLKLFDRTWNLKLDNESVVRAKNTVVATGATPKTMPLPIERELIDIYTALDPQQLANACTRDDTVAVIGSSHSAIILVRDLLQLGVQKVINFYREPLRFAVKLPEWILFDDTGLKGNTAEWARKYINGILPERLERIYSSPENIVKYLPTCTKVIQAIGFSRRAPIIEGFPEWKYNSANGIVAPGLFAIGIGFPESKTDPYGNTELRVGLWKFMDYLDKIIPLWLRYSI